VNERKEMSVGSEISVCVMNMSGVGLCASGLRV